MYKRQLNDPSRHDNQAMPLKSVLPAVRHQLNVLGRGVRHARHEVVEDLSALFCSKTVAVCYKAAGLLHKTRHASDFLPKHWSADFDYMLQLRGGAVLAPEASSPSSRSSSAASSSASSPSPTSGASTATARRACSSAPLSLIHI